MVICTPALRQPDQLILHGAYIQHRFLRDLDFEHGGRAIAPLQLGEQDLIDREPGDFARGEIYRHPHMRPAPARAAPGSSRRLREECSAAAVPQARPWRRWRSAPAAAPARAGCAASAAAPQGPQVFGHHCRRSADTRPPARIRQGTPQIALDIAPHLQPVAQRIVEYIELVAARRLSRHRALRRRRSESRSHHAPGRHKGRCRRQGGPHRRMRNGTATEVISLVASSEGNASATDES